MNIRHATIEDVPAIVAMSAKFYATTNYARFASMSEETVADLAATLVERGVMLIAEADAAPVGMVGLFVAPYMFNHDVRMAHEVVWWVEPTAQGAGIGRALLDAVEPACRELGVAAIQMMHLATSPPQAAEMYRRMGYDLSETGYLKELSRWP
jgi:GNAT superfamily N-acetyltransferase